MKNKNLLLIIDMQNDFCNEQGALFVPGAIEDTERLSSFIDRNTENIDRIILTQDSHHIVDISHPIFWVDEKGDHPAPFTSISVEDVLEERWKAQFYPSEALSYLKALKTQGEFPHIIWPEHCILGSFGAAITDNVMKALINWARQGKFFEIFQKGINPLTEHFGALRANIPFKEDKETMLNEKLANNLMQSENIFIAGEAKSHCVANTVKQIMELDGFEGKLFFLEDTMSNVTGFEEIALPIYNKALEKGAEFIKSTNFLLN